MPCAQQATQGQSGVSNTAVAGASIEQLAAVEDRLRMRLPWEVSSKMCMRLLALASCLARPVQADSVS
jgi:hypothetical protein